MRHHLIAEGDSMTLYLSRNRFGLRIFTQLDLWEGDVVGDVADILLPGQAFGGLSYDELAILAATEGKVDSDRLRAN